MSAQAIALLASWRRQRVQLVAPALLAFEVSSVLRRLVHRKELTPEEGEEAFADYLRMDIQLSHRRSIFPLAWKMAQQFNQPRTYDMAYLALAQLHQCPFWTADKRLYNSTSQTLPWVNWIGAVEGKVD